MRAAEPVAAKGRRCKLFAHSNLQGRRGGATNPAASPRGTQQLLPWIMDRLTHHQPSTPPAITSALPSSRSSANGCRRLAGSLAHHYEIVRETKGAYGTNLASVSAIVSLHDATLVHTIFIACRGPRTGRMASWSLRKHSVQTATCGSMGIELSRVLPRNNGGRWTIKQAAPHDC